MICKTLHRRQTIEQDEPQLKPEVPKKVMLFVVVSVLLLFYTSPVMNV
jgi:hypothetical protein